MANVVYDHLILQALLLVTLLPTSSHQYQIT